MKKMNNRCDAKLVFGQILKNSFFLRVDSKHKLDLYLGLNSRSQMTLRYTGNFKRIKTKNSKIIEINHYLIDNRISIDFSLVDLDFADMFYLFCNDLIESSREINDENAYIFLVNRYNKWKNFGTATNKFLSDQEIKGLLGELYFLREKLIPMYGVTRSISGWSGFEQTKKDFSIDDSWYEVKTATNDYVTISSIDQLESNNTGYLVVIKMEKMSPEYVGYTLNSLVKAILELIEVGTDYSIFLMKLMELGYVDNEYYDNFVFNIILTRYFEVNNIFPRLDRKTLPYAISNAKYDLLLNMLKEFEREENGIK